MRLRLPREANTFFDVGGGVRIDRSSQAEKHLGVYRLAKDFYRFSVLGVIYDDPIFKGLILTGGYGTRVKKAVVNIAGYNDQDLQLPLPSRGIFQGEKTVASLAIHDARFDSNRLSRLGPAVSAKRKVRRRHLFSPSITFFVLMNDSKCHQRTLCSRFLFFRIFTKPYLNVLRLGETIEAQTGGYIGKHL